MCEKTKKVKKSIAGQMAPKFKESNLFNQTSFELKALILHNQLVKMLQKLVGLARKIHLDFHKWIKFTIPPSTPHAPSSYSPYTRITIELTFEI